LPCSGFSSCGLIVNDANYAEIVVTLSRGIVTTLWVTLVAFTLATLLGLRWRWRAPRAIMVLRQLATFYVEIIRGIPILVALFYVAFVGAPWLVEAVNWLSPRP
jgi:polar amino acid transport system permease protein